MKRTQKMQLGGILLMILLLIGFYSYRKFALHFDHKYTMGILKSVESAVEGGPMARFEYTVNGKTYQTLKSVLPSEEDQLYNSINDTFFIKYQTSQPANIEIIYNQEATSANWAKIPADGWPEIPK